MAIDHERFMRAAIEEAAKGLAEGNIAVGSVVVRDDGIIGRKRGRTRAGSASRSGPLLERC